MPLYGIKKLIKMNRYATNKFDFIRGWKNAAGSRVISEAGPAQLAVTPTPVPTVNLVATPAPVSTPTVSAPVTSAPISSNTSSGSGGGGGGGNLLYGMGWGGKQ